MVRASSASNLFTWLNDLLIQHFCEILFKFISVLQRFLVLHILILVLVLIVLQKLGNFILINLIYSFILKCCLVPV